MRTMRGLSDTSSSRLANRTAPSMQFAEPPANVFTMEPLVNTTTRIVEASKGRIFKTLRMIPREYLIS
jgi:hypothetical protein